MRVNELIQLLQEYTAEQSNWFYDITIEREEIVISKIEVITSILPNKRED